MEAVAKQEPINQQALVWSINDDVRDAIGALGLVRRYGHPDPTNDGIVSRVVQTLEQALQSIEKLEMTFDPSAPEYIP